MKCEWCNKTAANRSGMSSHVRTSHPEHYLEWRKDSVMSTVDKKKYQAQLGHLVEGFKPEVVDKTSSSYKRKYQKSWYWRNKRRVLKQKREQRNGQVGVGDSSAQLPSKLRPENMHVAICPRCRCRFATMILEEGSVA